MAMLRSLMDHGAMAVKVKALYGRMLTPEDWRRLGGMTTVSETAAFLKTQPGWKTAMSSLPAGSADAREIEAALKMQVCDEYERLFSFASGRDKKFLLATLYHGELLVILAALRRLGAVHGLPSDEPVPEFYLRKSATDLDAVRRAANFQQLVLASEGGFYAPVLRALPRDPQTGLPDYKEASIALENRCYTEIYRFLSRDYTGKKKTALMKYLGERADILNLTHLLRLRRFPASLASADKLLIPVRSRLRPEIVSAIAKAPDDRAVLEILSATPWGRYFTTLEPDTLERQYRDAMTAFCRRLINAPEPSICMPQAYLTLKTMECGKLTTLIEARRLGVDVSGML